MDLSVYLILLHCFNTFLLQKTFIVSYTVVYSISATFIKTNYHF